MKLNFGHGITAGLVAFMGFILFLVYKTTTVNSELERPDYYVQEVAYGERMEQQRNYLNAGFEVAVNNDMQHVTIDFSGMDVKEALTGEARFVRPSDSRLDHIYDLSSLTGDQLVLKAESFVPGNYKLELTWAHAGTTYYYETNLFL